MQLLNELLLDPLKRKILHPINYLDMSGIQQSTNNHFIAALLAHAIGDVDFNSARRGICITSDMLVSALNLH